MTNARIDEMANTAKRIEEIIAPLPRTKREALPNIDVLLEPSSLTLEEGPRTARHTVQLILSADKTRFHYTSTLALAGELLEGIPQPNGTLRQVYFRYHTEDEIAENKKEPFTFIEDCPFFDGLEAFEFIAYHLINRYIS